MDKKAVVHNIHGVSTHTPSRAVRFEYSCKRKNVLTDPWMLLFTNHKPDVTCLQCLKKLAKGQDDG